MTNGAKCASWSLAPGQAVAFQTLNTACGAVSWPSDPELVVTAADIPDPKQLKPSWLATRDIAKRLNYVGGTTFDIDNVDLHDIGAVSSLNGTSEIGWSDSLGATTLAVTAVWSDAETCDILEADILFNTDFDWAFGVPERYYAAHAEHDGVRWFRSTLMHELLHLAGLAHEDTELSLTNYGTRPWQNRTDKKRIDPLPDDRQGLRALYPGWSSEQDVAVLNTGIDLAQSVAGSPAVQRLFAPPEVVPAGSPTPTAATFAPDKPTSVAPLTTVCAGDLLRVQGQIVNYGTETASWTLELWLSSNDWLNRTAGQDKKLLGSGAAGFFVGGQDTRIWSTAYVPGSLAPGSKWFVMSFVNTGDTLDQEESTQNNWIPATGKIVVGSQWWCDTGRYLEVVSPIEGLSPLF